MVVVWLLWEVEVVVGGRRCGGGGGWEGRERRVEREGGRRGVSSGVVGCGGGGRVGGVGWGGEGGGVEERGGEGREGGEQWRERGEEVEQFIILGEYLMFERLTFAKKTIVSLHRSIVCFSHPMKKTHFFGKTASPQIDCWFSSGESHIFDVIESYVAEKHEIVEVIVNVKPLKSLKTLRVKP